MKRKILNPYTQFRGYKCFGCSPDNPHGLKMTFVEDGEFVISEWEPKDFLQGFFNVLHGGIQATLMDEIGSWLVLIKLKTSGVTSNLSCRYLKSVPTDKGKITLRAKLVGQRRNLADVHVELFCPDGKLCAQSDITYFTFPPEVAKKKLYFPPYEQFFEKE